jgi:hypothetical protein
MMTTGLRYHHNARPALARLTFNGRLVAPWPAGLRATAARCEAVLKAWQVAGAAAALTTQEAADACGLAGLSGETAWFGARCREREKAGR